MGETGTGECYINAIGICERNLAVNAYNLHLEVQYYINIHDVK